MMNVAKGDIEKVLAMTIHIDINGRINSTNHVYHIFPR